MAGLTVTEAVAQRAPLLAQTVTTAVDAALRFDGEVYVALICPDAFEVPEFGVTDPPPEVSAIDNAAPFSAKPFWSLTVATIPAFCPDMMTLGLAATLMLVGTAGTGVIAICAFAQIVVPLLRHVDTTANPDDVKLAGDVKVATTCPAAFVMAEFGATVPPVPLVIFMETGTPTNGAPLAARTVDVTLALAPDCTVLGAATEVTDCAYDFEAIDNTPRRPNRMTRFIAAGVLICMETSTFNLAACGKYRLAVCNWPLISVISA